VFDRAFSIINKQKFNEMHSDCLLRHLNPTYMFRSAPAIFRVVVVKYQVKLFKNSVIKLKKGGPSIQ
jgi:hypothetical protein